MPRLLDYLSPAYSFLYAIDPALPQALFVSLVFFTVWLLRKLAPNQWEAFANLIYVKSSDLAWWQDEIRQLWQALPAAMIGTLYGILGTGADPKETLRTALLGLIAPVVHRVASRYKGQVGKSNDPGGPTGSKPVGLASGERDYTDVATPPEPPRAAMTALQRRRRALRLSAAFAWALTLFAVISTAVVLTGCTPAQWQAQAEVADEVARVSNGTVGPLLQQAYQAGGLAVIKLQSTPEDAQLALSVYKARWAPVWRCYDAFKAAHDSWQDVIATRGDPIPAALAARKALCDLRVAALEVDVHLPDFQPLRCGA